MADLTVARLRAALHYDPETGLFQWLEKKGGRRAKVGTIARRKGKPIYIRIRVDCGQYKAHRLAWLYMTGEWPKHGIDHRDIDPLNNQWANLRDATQLVNNCNRKSFKMRGVVMQTVASLRMDFAKIEGKQH